MNIHRILELLDDSSPKPRTSSEILDFVAEDSPHHEIRKAYDKASTSYDNYIGGDSFLLKYLKKLALGIDTEAAIEYKKITRQMLAQVKAGGIVLDMPAGTGLYTFEEYVRRPDILFVAAEYSPGMLGRAREKARHLKADNIVFVRADVGCLPFKAGSFDAVLCLNGIHSFPDKSRAISEMARVLKVGKSLSGSLILRGERWLTDLVLETAYYRLRWFTKPALLRSELLSMMKNNGLKTNSFRTLKSAAAFEAVKQG
jgi:ubiquinone/menaquinone biosynthesis C-methylase UbiE